MLIPILVLEALLRTTGALPLNVKVCFGGQEGIGSPDLPANLVSRKSPPA